MTQQWGSGPQPGQGGQWPTQQNWNRPGQAWGSPPAGQPGQGYAPYPQGGQYRPGQPPGQYAPQPVPRGQYPPPGYPPAQAQFGQPAYGQPGGFPQPGQGYPPGGPRRSPFRGVLLGLVLVVGIAFFAVALMNFLNGGQEVSGPTVNQTTAPVPQNTSPVPPPDRNPPKIPLPETVGEANDWLVENAVYTQTAPVPTNCVVPKIDITTASVGELNSHLNDLTACLWRVWSGPLEAAGFQLPRPPVTVYTDPITTGCGKLDDVNAVYCAADQRIYYAQPLWKILPEELQKDPFVVESVLAHEFGHTIQARTGILVSSAYFEQKAETELQGKVFSRRLEVQADCLAGIFTSAVGPSSGLSAGDLENLQNVFYSIGDDVLSGQANVQGDHGLGRSRKAWFITGQGNSLIGSCNSYTAPTSSVR